MSTLRVNTDSLANIYSNYTPAVKNLYEVIVYSGSGSSGSIAEATLGGDDGGLKSSGLEYSDTPNSTYRGLNTTSDSEYFKYHATDITLDEESLELVRNNATKQFTLGDRDAYKLCDNVSITWRESKDWIVRKYHEDWLANFYNKDYNCYVSATLDGNGQMLDSERGKRFRDFKIRFPNDNIKDDTYRRYSCIMLHNVIPSNIGNLQLSWNSSGDIVTFTITYKVQSWNWVEDEE